MSEETTRVLKTRPIHVERVGWVQASVWERSGKRGTYNEVTFRRGYTGTDGRVRYTAGFHLRDLTDLNLVLDRAAEAMRRRAKDRGETTLESEKPGVAAGSQTADAKEPSSPENYSTSVHT